MACKTLDPKVYAFITRYKELCGTQPTAEQALLIKYFEQAGDELPVFNDREWFWCAWRKVDIIYHSGMASKDMIVWHLIKIDRVIAEVVNELLPPARPEDYPS